MFDALPYEIIIADGYFFGILRSVSAKMEIEGKGPHVDANCLEESCVCLESSKIFPNHLCVG